MIFSFSPFSLNKYADTKIGKLHDVNPRAARFLRKRHGSFRGRGAGLQPRDPASGPAAAASAAASTKNENLKIVNEKRLEEAV